MAPCQPMMVGVAEAAAGSASHGVSAPKPAHRDEEHGDEAPRDERRDVGHDHAGEERAEALHVRLGPVPALRGGGDVVVMIVVSFCVVGEVRVDAAVAAARAADRADAASSAARAASAMRRASSRVCGEQDGADIGERRRRHRQGRGAEADEHDGEQRVGRSLAADADGLARWRAPAAPTSRTRRSTAGCHGSWNAATEPSSRSAASVYCVRSFVPIEAKSACASTRSASSALDGTSTMTPAVFSPYSRASADEVLGLLDGRDHRRHDPEVGRRSRHPPRRAP